METVRSFHSTPIEPFLEIIRQFKSTNPEALPQRSNLEVQDELFQFRMVNRDLYLRSKDEFVANYLRLNGNTNYSGLYFFFNPVNKSNPFFYIGKADDLFQRLTKHFLTFDYFFYAAAFPKNIDTYSKDCVRFYAEGKYEKNKTLYKRQFESFKISPFKSVGWISDPLFADPELLKIVESNSIDFYKPLANGTKGSPVGNERSGELFQIVKTIINEHFL